MIADSYTVRKPKFDIWVLSSVTSGLRIFQLLSSGAVCIFVGWVGSQFTGTYAVTAYCLGAVIVSLGLLIASAASLPDSTPSVNWIFWELLYTSSFSVMFVVNSVILLYSAFRWQHTAWWLATVVCVLATASFCLDFVRTISVFKRNPLIQHSQALNVQ